MLRKTLLLIVVVCMATTPFAGVVGAAPSTAVDHQAAASLSTNSGFQSVGINQDQEFDTDVDDLAIWERSILSLRADLGNAETTIDVPELLINTPDVTDRSADRTEVGVFEADGDDVTVELRNISDAQTSKYNDKNVTVILGQLNPDQSSSITDFSGLSMLTSFDIDNLNENMTFSTVEERELNISEGGTVEFDIDDPDAGQYVVFVSANDDNDGNGLRVEGDSLEEPNNTGSTIIGVEQFVVQDSASDVTNPDTAEPGDDITFDVSTDLSDEDVGHIVAVYNEDTFTGDFFRLTTDEEINSELSEEDFTLQHPIEDVNGVANLKDDLDNFGVQLKSDRVVGPQSLQDVIMFAAGELDQDAPELEVRDPPASTLDASVTAKVGSNNAEITVETLDSWAEGEYRFIHIASEESTSQFTTAEGTITIEGAEEDDDTTTGGSGGGQGGAAPTPSDDSEETVEDIDEAVEQAEPDVDTERVIEDADPDTPGVTVDTSDETTTIESIRFTDEATTGTVRVREYSNPAVIESTVNSLSAQLDQDVRTVGAVADITVNDGEGNPAANTAATVTMGIDADDIDDPENVVINHESADGWEQLETNLEEVTDDRVRISADVDGFSLFAATELEAEEDDDPDPEPEVTDDGIPGFGIVVAIISLIALALLARRKHS